MKTAEDAPSASAIWSASFDLTPVMMLICKITAEHRNPSLYRIVDLLCGIMVKSERLSVLIYAAKANGDPL